MSDQLLCDLVLAKCNLSVTIVVIASIIDNAQRDSANNNSSCTKFDTGYLWSIGPTAFLVTVADLFPLFGENRIIRLSMLTI